MLVGALVTLLVVILISIVRHYWLRAETNAYIAQLKAGGEPLDLTQVIPPSLPPEQNSADVFLQAVALENANERGWWSTNAVSSMTMVAPGKAMICWQQPDNRSPVSTNSWQEIAAATARDEKANALLQQIITKPDFDFQINYRGGLQDLDMKNMHLPETKRAAQRLCASTVYDLHAGDTASAVEDVCALLALSQALRDERFDISKLVRIAIAQITVSANWEVLQSQSLTDVQLAELQQSWTDLDFIQSMHDAMELERANQLLDVQKWRSSPAEFKRHITWPPDERGLMGLGPETLWDKAKMGPEIFLWREWWSYPDQLRALKGSQAALDALDAARTNNFLNGLQSLGTDLSGLDLAKGSDNSFVPYSLDLHTMLSEEASISMSLIRRVMAAEVAKQTAITAIALKRYQLKHGTYPPDLNALVPQFLPAVPQDPEDGQPLRYHLKDDGTFVLYSIGPNGKDDGGSSALDVIMEGSNYYWLNLHALDWVWPQPATPEEIRNFYVRSKN